MLTHYSDSVTRAAPLPAEERRAAIVAVTEPLLLARGTEVSTREIAEAAGVAEGTLFRVFANKEALIDAVFAEASDAAAIRAEIARIDTSADLETRVAEIAAVLQRRARRMFALIHATGYRPPATTGRRSGPAAPDRALAISAAAAVLEGDRHRLRVTPEQAAAHLAALVMALTHPLLSGHGVCGPGQEDPREIARLLLYGVARPLEARTEDSAC